MKRIDIYGYLNDNLGDDLMFYILLSRYPDIIFKYSDYWNSTEKFKKYKNFISNEDIYKKYGRINHLINLFTRKKDWFIKNKIKNKVVASLYIGGSVFIQRDNYIEHLEHENKKLTNGPLFVVGSNFGPYFSDDYVLKYREFFKNCYSVTFRDADSYSLFSDMRNIRLASDIVLSDFKLPDIKKEYKDYVVISVIDLKYKELEEYSDAYISFIKSIVRECINNKKIPCFVSFCNKEGDDDFIGRIYDQLTDIEKNKVKTLYYTNNIEEFLDLFRTCYSVVASRFHGVILAIKFNKPFFALSYSNKTENYLNDSSIESFCRIIDLEDIDYNSVNNYIFSTQEVKYNVVFEDPFKDFDSFIKAL